MGEPKSTQHIYRSTCRGGFSSTYMTAEGKSIKERYQWEAKSEWRQPLITDPIASLHVYFYFQTKRRRDLDNQNKLILDALTGVVYGDDSQIDELHPVPALR
jgi:crossover junction endodeoxyribonuclease RusA